MKSIKYSINDLKKAEKVNEIKEMCENNKNYFFNISFYTPRRWVGCFEITFDEMEKIIKKEYEDYEIFSKKAVEKIKLIKEDEDVSNIEEMLGECLVERDESIRAADNYYR